MVAVKRSAGMTDNRSSVVYAREHSFCGRCIWTPPHYDTNQISASQLPAPCWYRRTLFKKKMSPKGGNKHPASILPGSWEQESLSLGTRFADKELEDGKILDAQRTPVRRHHIGDQLRRFIERRQFLDSGMHLFKLSGSCAVWNQTDCVRL